jgi:hypothetical protein
MKTNSAEGVGVEDLKGISQRIERGLDQKWIAESENCARFNMGTHL